MLWKATQSELRNMRTKFANLFMAAAYLTMMAAEVGAFPIEPFNNVISVRNDRGGQVVEYAARAKEIAKADKKVRFSGNCDSACTIYLSIPRKNLCINKGASFGFHLPYGSSARGNRTAAKYIINKYPAWVRRWIATKGGLKNRIKRMDYKYASKHIGACKTQVT